MFDTMKRLQNGIYSETSRFIGQATEYVILTTQSSKPL